MEPKSQKVKYLNLSDLIKHVFAQFFAIQNKISIMQFRNKYMIRDISFWMTYWTIFSYYNIVRAYNCLEKPSQYLNRLLFSHWNFDFLSIREKVYINSIFIFLIRFLMFIFFSNLSTFNWSYFFRYTRFY